MSERVVRDAVLCMAGFGSGVLERTIDGGKSLSQLPGTTWFDETLKDLRDIGIENVTCVVGPDDAFIRERFGLDRKPTRRYLVEKGKNDKLEFLDEFEDMYGLTINFVTQDMDDPTYYGTAIPIANAFIEYKPDGETEDGDVSENDSVEPVASNEDRGVLILLGDDMLKRRDGGNELGNFVNFWEESDGDHAISSIEKPEDKIAGTNLGVLDIDENGNLIRIVEKPKTIEEVPSRCINIGKFIVKKELLVPVLVNYLRNPRPINPDTGKPYEYYFTDVITNAIKGMDVQNSGAESPIEPQTVSVYKSDPSQVVWLDVGNDQGWSDAVMFIRALREGWADRWMPMDEMLSTLNTSHNVIS